jgi:hypothetical protein
MAVHACAVDLVLPASTRSCFVHRDTVVIEVSRTDLGLSLDTPHDTPARHVTG